MKWVIILIAAGGVLLPSGSILAQTEYPADGVPTGMEEEIRWLMNRGRFDLAGENRLRGTAFSDVPASAGPLAPNQSLTLAARHHAEDMARHNLLQHDTVPGSAYYNATTQPTAWARITAEGYSWTDGRENIGAGFPDAEAAYVAWWNSASHRQNMYHDGLREIGTGYYYWSSSNFRHYFTMDLGSSGSTRFFTDTMFLDANGDGIYQRGEAIAGIGIRLLINGRTHTYGDLSSKVGSFAIPIQSIAAGAAVQVVLSNTTTSRLSLSIPRSYASCTQVTLAPGETWAAGAFTQGSTVRNMGLRDVAPIVAPVLSLARSGRDMLIHWPSEVNLKYLVQRSADLITWSNLVANYKAGTGAGLSLLDVAPPGPQGYYRVLLQSR